MASILLHLLVVFVSLLSLIAIGGSDFAADRAECMDQLIGLATCLPYVGGDAKLPTPDCCTGYNKVTESSVKCVCVLIKDRNEPELGLTVNISLAIQLPKKCGSPFNVSTCTSILKVPPSSKAAKEFQQFENILEGKSSNDVKANNITGVVGAHASNGRRERFYVVWTWFLLLIMILVLKY